MSIDTPTRIKAILYDMDGVLIDAKDWHYEALNDALALFGMEIARDEHLALYDGLPTRRKLEMLSASRHLPPRLHGFINEMKQRRTIELAYSRCRPFFHHQYALSRLQAEGYRQAACSNSIRNTVSVMLGQAALLPYFEFYLSNEDVAHPKPHPEIYQAAMERMGLAPTECLVVEDNDHGIRAAKASGAHVMEVADIHGVTYDRIRRHIARAQGETP